MGANIAKLPVSRSARDAQLLLDVGHHRVRQARLAEVRKVLSDGLLPYPIIRLGDLPFMGKVECFSLFIVPREHECIRPVGLNPEIVRKKRMSAISDG